MTEGSIRVRVLIGSALPLLLIGSLQTDPSLAAERPDFSGKWRLNEELSENPRDKMMEKVRGGGARGEMGGRRGGEIGGRPGGAAGGRDGGGPEDMQERMRAMYERIQNLEITHQEPEVAMVFADGATRKLYTDGRDSGDDLEAGFFGGTGKWKNKTQLVWKSETSNGSKVTEIYELDNSGERLFVTIKMEGDGRRPDISFQRVYDAADAGVPAETNPEGEVG